MTAVADIVRVAQSQLGYREGPNNDNKFGIWWGLDNQPWCDLFTSWVFHTAGAPRPSEQIPGREGSASVNYTQRYWAARGLFRPSTESEVGDLILFDWTGAEDGHDWNQTHIGIIVGRSGSTLTTIEGNTSDHVHGDGVYTKQWTAGGNLIWGTCNMQALIASGKGTPPAPTPLPPKPQPTAYVPAYGMALVLTTPLMHNNHVLIWQQQMVKRGWNLSTDGYYGPASMAACRAFQSEKGLQVDGIVGPNTWMATWTSPVT